MFLLASVSAGLILGTLSYIGHFRKTFPEHFVSLYYGRHLNADEVHTILLQAYAEEKEAVCAALASNLIFNKGTISEDNITSTRNSIADYSANRHKRVRQ
jgi:hypothetical protein